MKLAEEKKPSPQAAQYKLITAQIGRNSANLLPTRIFCYGGCFAAQ
jgi:hypothetical protein